ncbi:YtxH domain-containing protein [Flavobacterium procerum]|uniref:YtxH domain-containing protein n=1 Tax=Flavobacterium procerum TaxID=1455569 RepID=A0ABV6BQA2_9FLAO
MGLTSFFKNIFGTAKDSASDLAVQAENTIEKAIETATPYIEKAEAFAEEAIENAKDVAEPILESAADFAQQARETFSEYAEKAVDSITEAVDIIKEKTAELNSDPEEKIVGDNVVDTSEKAIIDAD